jgi:hypothetical protein
MEGDGKETDSCRAQDVVLTVLQDLGKIPHFGGKLHFCGKKSIFFCNWGILDFVSI